MSIIINEFKRGGTFSTTAPYDEYIEFLLTTDFTATQLESLYFGDSTGTTAAKFGVYKFANLSTISTTFKAGTIIAVGGTAAIATQDTAYNPIVGGTNNDWNIQLQFPSTFLTNTNTANSFDLAASDVVWIDNSNTGTTSIDSITWGTSGAFGSAAKVRFTTVPGNPTGTTGNVEFTGDGTGVDVVGNYSVNSAGSIGAPNTGGTNTAYITTLRNGSQPTVTIAAGTTPNETGPVAGTYTVTLSSAAPTGGLTVNYTLSTSGATNPADFTTPAIGTGTLSIAAGATTGTITLATVDDAVVDPGETATVTLNTGTGYTVGAANVATLTIADNDGAATPTVTIAAGTTPNETGPVAGTYTVTLSSAAPAGGLTVNYTLSTSGATNPADFTAPAIGAGTLSIAAGATTGTITLATVDDTAVDPGETATVTLNTGTGYTVGAANAATLTIADNDTAVTLTPIYTIQGSGTASTLANTIVTTEGIVVGDYQGTTGANGALNGFFIQDPTGDGNALTSDGIFVFIPTANALSNVDVNPGDRVRITGTVKEFSTLTEIDTVTALTVLSTGNPAIAPTTVVLPETVNNDLERYEGMLVNIPQTMTVSQNYFQGRYGEVTLSSDGRLFNPTNVFNPSSAAATALADENARRLLVLDDGKSSQNPNPIPYIGADNTLRAGDTVTGLTGVFDYGLISSDTTTRDYRLQPTVTPTFTRVNNRTAVPEPVGGTLKVVGMNVLNYFTTYAPTGRGADNAAEFTRQRDKIISAITTMDADVLGLSELENNTAAIDNLVAGLNAVAGAGTYAKINDPTTGVGTDAIKVGLIYKPGKVTPVGVPLSDNKPIYNRVPVAQTFKQNSNNEIFTPIINHFKSKSSSAATGLDLDQNDGQGAYNDRRKQQATALLDFINTAKTTSGDNDVLVIGDLNSYAKEDPIKILTTGGLTNEIAKYVTNPYSFVFDGQSGYLDHALSTASLSPQITGVSEWHINADEPEVINYDLDFKTQDLYTPTPYRASDHDPVVVGLNLSSVEIAVLDNTTDITDGTTTPVNIGTATVGTPVSKTFTITNSGAGTLTLGTPTLTGSGFTVVGTFPTSVGPSSSATFQVQLTAAAQGTFNGGISFVNNDSNENAFDFPLIGTVNLPAVPEIEVLDGTTNIVDGTTTPAINIGTATVGTPVTKTFTINNTGTAALTLGTSTLPTGFTLVAPLPSSIAAGGNATFQVQLAATAAGTPSGILSFVTNDSDENPFDFAIAGTVNPPSVPEIQVLDNTTDIADGTTTAINIGTATVGTPVSKTFTINNTGTAALTLGTPTLPTGFSLVGSFPTSIAAGTSANFGVRVDATTAGTPSGTFSFTTNDSDEALFDFVVSGTVSPPAVPEIQVLDGATDIADGTNTAINIGTATVGTPVTKSFTVKNTGTAALTLGTSTLPTGFTLVAPLPSSIAAGGSATFQVQLAATAAGTPNGILSFVTNDSDENPFDFAIAGTVNPPSTPEIQVLDGAIDIPDGKTTPVNIGTATVGGSPISKSFTVKNTGTAVLNLSTPTLPTGFTFLTPVPSTVAAGGSATFSVQLNPTTAGTPSGILSFVTNDSDENPFDFAISATVNQPSTPEIEVFDGATDILDGTTTPVNIGTATIGTPVAKTFTVKNSGTAALTLGTPTLPNGFSLLTPLPASVAAGGSASFQVQLAATTAGTFNGTLSFTNNDSNENPYDFAISGTVNASTSSASPDGTLAQKPNNIFQIGGSTGQVQLKFTKVSNDGRFVNEIAAFVVDDDAGTINGIAPGQPGYLAAALAKSKVVFSLLPSGNFESGNNTSQLGFNAGSRLGFYLVSNGTTDTARADIAAGRTPGNILFGFPSGNGGSQDYLRVSQTGTDPFTLSWEDAVGGGDRDYNDIVLNVQVTKDAAPIGARQQGDTEIIDLTDYAGRKLSADVVVTGSAAYNDFVGLYRIDDATGKVGNLKPGDAGYAKAALERAVVEYGNRNTRVLGQLDGGGLLAPFIVANASREQLLSQNPTNQSGSSPNAYFSFLGANPDGVDHIRLLGNNTFGFEDLKGGGDRDFNDAVFQVNNLRVA